MQRGQAEIDKRGAVAQLGERLLCKQGVTGSIPVSSTNLRKRLVIDLFFKSAL